MHEGRNAKRALAAAGLGALAAIAAGEMTATVDQGPSSSATPYVVPVAAGVRTISILTVGDSVNPKLDGVTPYRMVGIPDGLGILDTGDGKMLVTMNHEIGAASGVARAHGSLGAFVSAWTIDKETLEVESGNDLIRTVETWNASTQQYAQGPTAFARFCSGDLPARGAFHDPASGLGTTERFHVAGEENGNAGRAFATLVTGPNTGVSWELPRMGKQSWENVVACPLPQTTTLVALDDDTSSPGGQVFFYVGTKLSSGNAIQKAGLANGTLYGLSVPGVAQEDRSAGIGTAKGVAGPFVLAALPDQSLAGSNTETAAVAAGATMFLRPEDGAWDPLHPSDYWFATTDRADQVADGLGTQIGRSRLWRVHFTDVATPTLGGTITMALDGTEGQVMFDNLCVDRTGHILLQEDAGGSPHNGKVWRYDVGSGALTVIAKHDPARFGDVAAGVVTAATPPFSSDEESSGIVDAADLLGPGWFLLDVQAHASAGDTELVEHGQLLALYDPECVAPPTIDEAASANPSPALTGQLVTFSVSASTSGDGALTYAWTFGDGATASTRTASHAYATSGVHTAAVTVTHTASGRTATSSVDVSVERPYSGFEVAVQLVFGKGGKPDRNFPHGWDRSWRRSGRDQLGFRAELPIADGFSPAGKVVAVDIGGVQRAFTLGANGRASVPDGTCSLRVRKAGGTVPSQRGELVVILRGDDVQTALADETLTDRSATNEPVLVLAKVTFDGRTESQVIELIYNASQGKRGYAE